LQRKGVNDERDHSKCVICGKSSSEAVLHVAHIISDCEYQELKKKYPDFKIDVCYDDINLFTCCEGCNLGQGSRSLIPKLAVFVSVVIDRNKQEAPE